MKHKLNYLVITILAFAIFLSLIKNFLVFDSNLQGEYILRNDENCHLLPYDSDTLFLKENGTVISHNFPKDTRYAIKGDVLGKQLELTFNNGQDIMVLPISRTLTGRIILRLCLDVGSHYVKISR